MTREEVIAAAKTDVWVCPVCGNVVTAPAIRTYEPNTQCFHHPEDARVAALFPDLVTAGYAQIVIQMDKRL